MQKKPQSNKSPSDKKEVRAEPPNIPTMKPLWAFRNIDNDGHWGWKSLDSERFIELLERLGKLETMTWSEIERGTGSHLIEVENLHKNAQRRLVELKRDDVTQLFSLRLSGERRAWGHREGHVLCFLWYDPHHEVCPSRLRNT